MRSGGSPLRLQIAGGMTPSTPPSNATARLESSLLTAGAHETGTAAAGAGGGAGAAVGATGANATVGTGGGAAGADAGPAGAATAGASTSSQSKRSVASRCCNPNGPLTQVFAPSVKAVQFPSRRQTSSPPVVRWRVL